MSKPIQCAKNMWLDAVPVRTWEDVLPDGQIYWLDEHGHFAWRLGGELFHGNVGKIYDTARTHPGDLRKIRECIYRSNCPSRGRCTFYHDPLLGPIGRQDVRNWQSNWANYDPQNWHLRNYGNKACLEEDLRGWDGQKMRQNSDWISHETIAHLSALRGLRAPTTPQGSAPRPRREL